MTKPDRAIHAITLRLDQTEHITLQFMAKVAGISVSQEVRLAIKGRIAERQRDPAFQEEMAKVMKGQKALYRKLSKT